VGDPPRSVTSGRMNVTARKLPTFPPTMRKELATVRSCRFDVRFGRTDVIGVDIPV
jgi:hypothetical protein